MADNIESRVNILERDIGQLEAEVQGAMRALVELQRGLREVKMAVDPTTMTKLQDAVERLIQLVDGDPNRDVVGLRMRLQTVEARAKEIVAQRDALKWILLGMGITNASTLIALLVKLFGGP